MLRDIVHQIDSDDERGFRKYWEFDDPEDWLGQYFENVPELGEDGLDAVTENGFWPFYGELDPATGKVLNDDEDLIEAEYGSATADGFATPSGKIEIYSKSLESRGLEPLPTWVEPENLQSEREGLTFVTYKTAYQNGSASLNNKYLAQKSHSNHCMINKETAAELGIKDGALIRITSDAGYMVTRARATNAIHPEVVAVAAGFNQSGIGRVAGAHPKRKRQWTASEDIDVHYNLWWRDTGVNPNDIIPPFVDPAGGGEALAFIVTVEPAQAGDSYGDIKVNNKKLVALFKSASEQKNVKEG
jgi:anaerobic selenocysteine-containing dehydrogenase